MHVTPAELRVIHRSGLDVRFARLGGAGFVLVDVPAMGSQNTALEDPCEEAHWGFVLRGSLELELPDRDVTLAPGTAFHLPSGTSRHLIRSGGAAVLADFVPLSPNPAIDGDRTDRLGTPGFGAIDLPIDRRAAGEEPLVIAGATRTERLEPGRIEARTGVMGEWIWSHARFGPTSGYTGSWCDAEHYGMLLTGGLAIESEDDVEVLAPGDVFYCPPGPPGHRLQAADGATIVDFTPRHALQAGGRIVDWRLQPRATVFA